MTIRPTTKTLRDIMAGHQTAEILNLFNGQVVRRLTVKGDVVGIDFLTETVDFPLDTAVLYQPWTMDRGSMLIECSLTPDGYAKLCTELDPIRFPDGTQREVLP